MLQNSKCNMTFRISSCWNHIYQIKKIAPPGWYWVKPVLIPASVQKRVRPHLACAFIKQTEEWNRAEYEIIIILFYTKITFYPGSSILLQSLSSDYDQN